MSSGQTERAFRVPGGQLVRLESDLPVSTITKIADDHGWQFLFLLTTPEAGTGTALEAIYRACCEYAGVEPPEKITARLLLKALETVDDLMPEEYEDGIPKEEETSTI